MSDDTRAEIEERHPFIASRSADAIWQLTSPQHLPVVLPYQPS